MSTPWRDIPLVDTREAVAPWQDIPLQDIPQVEPEVMERLQALAAPVTPGYAGMGWTPQLEHQEPKTRVQQILDDRDEREREEMEIQTAGMAGPGKKGAPSAEVEEAEEDPQTRLQKAVDSFQTGGAGLVDLVGGGMIWAGFEESGKSVRTYAQAVIENNKVKELYEEFEWSDMADPDFYLTKGVQMIPSLLTLIPLAVGGGILGGVAAGALGAGTLVISISAAVASAVAARPLESAMEAAGTFNSLLDQGASREQASEAAADVFTKNMALIGMDAAQFALAFAKIPAPLRKGMASWIRRVGPKAVGFAAGAASEGYEEVLQGYFQELGEQSLNGEVDASILESLKLAGPEAKEAFVLGTMGGVAFQTVGTVKQALSPGETDAIIQEQIDGAPGAEVVPEKGAGQQVGVQYPVEYVGEEAGMDVTNIAKRQELLEREKSISEMDQKQTEEILAKAAEYRASARASPTAIDKALIAAKEGEVGVQAPKEGIKPEIRPEIPVKVPPREVKAAKQPAGGGISTTVPKEVERSIKKIETIDKKIKVLEQESNDLRKTTAAFQPPPSLERMLDKVVDLQKQRAKIWNEEIRKKIIPSTGKTFWQTAVLSPLPVATVGEETLLGFGAPEIRGLAVPEKGAAFLKVQEVKKPKPKREQGRLELGVQAQIPKRGIRAPEGAPAPEEGAPLWEAGKEEAAREAEKRQVKIGEVAEQPAEPLFAPGRGRYAGQTILDPRRSDEMPALEAITGVSAAKDYPDLLEGVKWGHRGKSPVGATDIIVRDKAMPQDYDLLVPEELPPSFITKYGPESVRDKTTGGLDFDKLAELAENEVRDVVFGQGEYAGEPQYQEAWEPANLEEATKFYSVAGPIDPELVRAGIREAQSLGIATKKVLERFVLRGTTHMRKLGEGGRKLAKDIDEITFNVQREANNDALDIRKIMKGLTPRERTRVAMVTDNEIPIHTQTKRVVERSNRLRKVLDRQLKEFAAVGGERRLGGPGDKKIPAGGWGRAFPQVPNKEGRAVLKELSTGAMTPRVVQAAEWLVEKGKAKNYDEAIQQLSQIRNSQLRSVNPYFERTRTPLPTYLREWDPYKVLSGSMERNWMTIEGIRKWGWDEKGESFPGANELIGKIAQEKPYDAEVVHQFIRSSFGFGSKASESAQRISRDLRAVQFVGKIAVSPLTITRNMIDRFAKGYTTGGLSVTLRATLKFPPYVNVFIKSARQIKDQMIRSGAVFSHGSIAEGVEPGGIVMKMIGQPFTASERGNQIHEALVAKLKLERDIQLYLEAKPESRLGEIFKTVQSLGENTEVQITDRIKEAGLAEKSTEEMVDLLAKSKGADMPPIEVQAVLHRAARDQAFPVILSTKRLWWEDSPFLKVLTQFKVWPVEQVGFIYRSAMKQAYKGNVLPLVRFIVGVIIAGELYNIARDAVYDREEALFTNLRRRPDKRNAKDIAWILYKDALDGGLIGMFADLTWGLTDWVLGPTAGTIGELGKTMLSALRRPGLTVDALKKAMRRDVSAVRQAEGLLNKVGVLVGRDGKRAVLYNRWRFRANEYWREKNVGLFEKVERTIMGPPSYPVGKNSLVYELIARSVTANDVEGAAEYVEILFSEKDTLEERKKKWQGLKLSRASRSPLGLVALKNRVEFFKSFGQEDKDEAVKLQKAWLADYNRAIKLIQEGKRVPGVSTSD